VSIPPPNETVVSGVNHLLEKLEQMEQFIRRMTAALSDEASVPWAIAHRVCDRYRIPKAA